MHRALVPSPRCSCQVQQRQITLHILHQSQAGRPCQPARASKRPNVAVTSSDLIQAASGQQFGASSTDQQKQQLLRLVSELKGLHDAAHSVTAPTEGPLDGDWQLLWTSEASVHSIVRRQLLGAPVTDIQQHVDLQGRRVTNTIGFGWLSLQLQASGPLTVLNSSRIYYSFDKLQLRVLSLQLPLPVFFKGGGWTDCVLLLDDNLRVMENSRRDTLVLQRCTAVAS